MFISFQLFENVYKDANDGHQSLMLTIRRRFHVCAYIQNVNWPIVNWHKHTFSFDAIKTFLFHKTELCRWSRRHNTAWRNDAIFSREGTLQRKREREREKGEKAIFLNHGARKVIQRSLFRRSLGATFIFLCIFACTCDLHGPVHSVQRPQKTCKMDGNAAVFLPGGSSDCVASASRELRAVFRRICSFVVEPTTCRVCFSLRLFFVASTIFQTPSEERMQRRWKLARNLPSPRWPVERGNLDSTRGELLAWLNLLRAPAIMAPREEERSVVHACYGRRRSRTKENVTTCIVSPRDRYSSHVRVFVSSSPISPKRYQLHERKFSRTRVCTFTAGR